MPAQQIKLNLAGVLPSVKSKKIVHGGKVKLLHLREKFGDSWKNFNIAYFVSSGLPFAPNIWIRIYRLFGIKVVWNQNGVAYPALYSPQIVKRINNLYKSMDLADYVIYQTRFTKKCADKFIGTYKGASIVLINPVDTEYFVPAKNLLPKKPLVIIMAGNHFESRERMRVSLSAIRILQERGVTVKLIIIGQPENYTDEEIKRAGLENWVEKKGIFRQEEAPSLYQTAHILLHLKYLDPCPTVVLEALSCGLPVIGSASGGLPEMVDESSGILIPIKEGFGSLCYPKPEDVADAFIRILKNLPEFSMNARIGAVNKFDVKKWLGAHEIIFKKLCQKYQ